MLHWMVFIALFRSRVQSNKFLLDLWFVTSRALNIIDKCLRYNHNNLAFYEGNKSSAQSRPLWMQSFFLSRFPSVGWRKTPVFVYHQLNQPLAAYCACLAICWINTTNAFEWDYLISAAIEFRGILMEIYQAWTLNQCHSFGFSLHFSRRLPSVWAIQVSWWWPLHIHSISLRRGTRLWGWVTFIFNQTILSCYQNPSFFALHFVFF